MEHFYGCHLPSTNIFKSIDEVNKHGGNFIQIFVTNPLGRASLDALEKYTKIGPEIKQYATNNLTKIIVHAPYVLNFAKDFYKHSNEIKRILLELRIADKIGAIGCVIHVGKSLKLDINNAVNNMYLSIKYILSVIKDEKLDVKLILETAAGQGTELFVTEENALDDLANFYHRFT